MTARSTRGVCPKVPADYLRSDPLGSLPFGCAFRLDILSRASVKMAATAFKYSLNIVAPA